MIHIDDEFYKDDAAEEAPQEPTKLKIGEEEYDPEEAQRLLSLGKIAKEAEEKYNTKIDRVFPEYTKATQKLSEYQKADAERERQALEAKQASGADLSPEEQSRVGRETLKKFGVMFEDEYQNRFDNDYETRKLRDQMSDRIDKVVSDAKDKYGIATTRDQIIRVLQADGQSLNFDPDKAFRSIYEPKIKAWEEKQLQESKPQGLVTEAASTAGSKQPAQPRPNRDTLESQVLESLLKGS